MKLKHILIAGGLGLMGSTIGHSQQSAQFGQFQYNMLEINPAYASYRETFNITAINRNQWVGFKGAPITQTLSFNKPIKKTGFAMGGTVSNDRIGPSNSLQLSADGAAILFEARDRERTTLSLGIKLTGNYYQADLQSVNLIDDQDESFFRNEKGVFLANGSIGAMMYGKTYFLGASVIKLKNNRLVNQGNDHHTYMEGKEQATFYLNGGKIWKINRQLSVYPAFLFKAQKNAPISGGAFFNFLIMSDFKVGGYYNYKEVAGGIIQWQINRKFRVGYTFEVATNNLIRTNYGSHELMLNYELHRGRTAIIYPKHF